MWLTKATNPNRKMKIFHHICQPNPVLHPQVCLLHLVLYHPVNKQVVPLILYQHSNLLLQLAHQLALNPVCQHLHIHHQDHHHHLLPAPVSLYSLLLPVTVPSYQQIIFLESMRSTWAPELMIYLKCRFFFINLSTATGIMPLLKTLPLYLIYVAISQPTDNPSLGGRVIRKVLKYK